MSFRRMSCVLGIAIACSLMPETLASNVSLSSQTPANGTLVMVTVHPDATAPSPVPLKGATGTFEGTSFPFYPLEDGSVRAVFGIPLEHKPGDSQVEIEVNSQKVITTFKVSEGNYEIKKVPETIKVDARHVEPDAEDLERIHAEQKEIGKVYSKLTFDKYWSGPFVLPVQSQITSPFGTRRLFNGKLDRYHKGVDLRAYEKTPIHAPAPGIVVLAKNLFYTGNTVILDHGYGIMTLYAHMSKLKVKLGKKVKTGTLLGLSGHTGRADAAHLHWQAIIHKVTINPIDLTRTLQ